MIQGASMQKIIFCRQIFLASLLATLGFSFITAPAWAVWSCWYWPWHDSYNPNLYDNGEAMQRYDYYTGANSQGWEYYFHGPVQNPDPWWGHCHAWAGAAVWEDPPTEPKTIGNIEFRIRDRKGLLVETYSKCADGTAYELYANDPSPGLFWRYLRDEIGGYNPMHGKSMGFVGELYYGDEVWNYPIYNYNVVYFTSQPYSGRLTIWVAVDGKPQLANTAKSYYKSFTYQFGGVYQDSRGNPTDSGWWIGQGPNSRPDAIWRPYYATTWMQYVENTQLSESALHQILK